MASYRHSSGNNMGSDGSFGAAIFGIGIFCFAAYFAFLGLLAFAAALLTAYTAVIQAVALSLVHNGGLLSVWSEDALCGLVTGVIVGLIRALFRIRWRMTESLIGALFSSRLFRILRSTPGAWSLIFFTIATSTLVGYAVGVFMDAAGAPSIVGSDFQGPVAALLASGAGGGAGGGGDLLLAICIALVLIIACVLLAIAIAITANILFGIFIGTVGGSIKGATRAFAIATVESRLPGRPPALPRRPLTLLCKDGAVTGLVTGLITGFLFALNGVATHGAADGGGIHAVALAASLWTWTHVLIPVGTFLGTVLYYLAPIIFMYVVLPGLKALLDAWQARRARRAAQAPILPPPMPSPRLPRHR